MFGTTQVSAAVARGGLLEGGWVGRDKQVTAMSDDEVTTAHLVPVDRSVDCQARAEYKRQSVEIWHTGRYEPQVFQVWVEAPMKGPYVEVTDWC